MAAAAIEELLKKAQASRGGPAADAYRKAAQLTRERGDFLGAVELYERAVAEADKGPAEPRLRATIELELGALYEDELGRIDQAMASYERAFKVDPDNAHAIDAGRRVYRALGDWPMVTRLYEVELETASSRDKRGEILVALGRLHAEKLQATSGRRRCGSRRRCGCARTIRWPRRRWRRSTSRPTFPRRATTRRSSGARPASSSSSPTSAPRAATSRGRSRFCAARSAPIPITSKRRRGSSAPISTSGGRTSCAASIARARRCRGARSSWPSWPSRPATRTRASAALVEAHDEGDDTALVVERLEELLTSQKKWAQIAELREAARRRARAGAIAPTSSSTWRRTGSARPTPSASRASLLEALAADPVHPEAYQLLAEHLTQKRDYATLVGIAEQAVEAAPLADQPRRLAELADLYEKKLGDIAMAADAWRRAEALSPSPKGGSELKRLTQKQERWASMTASLERELESARDKRHPRRGAQAARAGLARAARSGARARSCGTTRCSSSRRTDRFIARSPSCRSARATRPRWPRRCASSCKRGQGEGREAQPPAQARRRLYDERLHDVEGVEWACERDPRAAARRLRCAAPARGGVQRGGRGGEGKLIDDARAARGGGGDAGGELPLLHRLAALYEKRGDAAAAADWLERASSSTRTI